MEIIKKFQKVVSPLTSGAKVIGCAQVKHNTYLELG